MAVADRVGEGLGAVGEDGLRVAESAVGVDGHRAVAAGRLSDSRDGQSVAVGVEVVGQDVDGGGGNRVQACRIVCSYRRAVLDDRYIQLARADTAVIVKDLCPHVQNAGVSSSQVHGQGERLVR